MQLIKSNKDNQVFELRKKLKRTKNLLRHKTSQLPGLTNEGLIKLKLRQCDELNKQRISLEDKIGRYL